MALYLWIAVGSALGGIARFALSGFVEHQLGPGFPWGTLLVNISGSFAIGFIATLTEPAEKGLPEPALRHFTIPGILGGFTTYSAFSWQTLALARQGEWLKAGGYAIGTFVVCFIAVWLGFLCATWIKSFRAT